MASLRIGNAVVVLFLASASAAASESGCACGLAYYFDSRSFNTLAASISLPDLGWGIGLWGFTDVHSRQLDSPHRFDLSRSFSEYRLSRRLAAITDGSEVGLEAEYNDQVPGEGSVVRFGVTLRHPLPVGRAAWFQWRLHPIETLEDQSQYSLIYSVGLMSRLYISGFADYNVRRHEAGRWVIEPQLSLSLGDRYTALLEYRYNGYEDHAVDLDGTGVALGVRVAF